MSVCDKDIEPGKELLDESFNPCFSGCRSAIPPDIPTGTGQSCFNPCFSGCRSAITLLDLFILIGAIVSILVLVDVGLRFIFLYTIDDTTSVSILVLVDVGLR